MLEIGGAAYTRVFTVCEIPWQRQTAEVTYFETLDYHEGRQRP